MLTRKTPAPGRVAPRRSAGALTVLAVASLTLGACTVETEPDTAIIVDDDPDVVVVTDSPSPTPMAPTGPAPDQVIAGEGNDPVLVFDPSQPVEVVAGTEVRLELVGRDDGADIDTPLALTTFACSTVVISEAGVVFGDDADENAHADAGATSNTGKARLTSVAGADPDEDGFEEGVRWNRGQEFVVTAESPAEDCVVVVAFDDADGDELLDLAVDGRPIETFGAAVVRWS